MSIYQNLMQPPPVRFSGYSEPMIGHVIPGVKIAYPVITRNYDDLGEQVRHKQAINPVVKFPGMHDEHSAGHPMIQKLKQLLTSGKKGQLRKGYEDMFRMFKKTGPKEPQLKEGYERMSEDLSWRSQSQLATTHTQASHGTQT
jgi:hypothetical protein